MKEIEELALNSNDTRETLNFKCMDMIVVAKKYVDLIKRQGIENPDGSFTALGKSYGV